MFLSKVFKRCLNITSETCHKKGIDSTLLYREVERPLSAGGCEEDHGRGGRGLVP